MKTLYIDCGMGAAGDMLTAALIDLFSDKEAVVRELNGLNIPGVEYSLAKASKCGITGLHMDVFVNGREEDEHMHDSAACEAGHAHGEHTHGSHDHGDHIHGDHAHGEHSHGEHSHGGHTHTHTGLHQIEHIVWDLGLKKSVESDVLAVYKLIAEAESNVHGVPVTDIHFHEVGTMDAVADIVAVCFLLDKLGVDEIVASPVHAGSGTVKCAHGILPVPAPATAFLLQGIPTYSTEIKGELCTPTGAALLKHFVTRFGAMPSMITSAIGYGMGKKDFERANCVRVMLGEPFSAAADSTDEDRVLELSCNVDDMTAEEIGFATERLMESGALDVYTVPIGMKKNRPGTLIRVLCNEDKKNGMIEQIFKHTSTIGIRETSMRRHVLKREIRTINTPYGEVRDKEVSGFGITRDKLEYEDLAGIAKRENISLREARELITLWKKNN